MGFLWFPRFLMFTPRERARYDRHFILPGFGKDGQERLKTSAVLCIGAGGLGSPAALYLAAAGVGRLGIIDDDRVDLSNLQRQILHAEAAIGTPKVRSAENRLRGLNADIVVEAHALRLTAANVRDLFAGYDLIIDGSDNFPTRFLAGDGAWLLSKPLVSGSIFQFEGQLTVFDRRRGTPCFRCLLPEPPPPGAVPGCDEAGVVGALPGVVGSLQAMEAVKILSGCGESLAGRLLHYDALRTAFREVRLARDPQCPLCGPRPLITAPAAYDASCAADPPAVPEIGVEELREALDNGFRGVLLDVRQVREHRGEKIAGSRLVPLAELPGRLEALPADQCYYVYCSTGKRSARAVSIMREAGFREARNVRGGIVAWRTAGGATEEE